MTTASILGLCSFAVTSVYVLWRAGRFYRLTQARETFPDAEFRDRARRMMKAVAYWQVSLGVVLLTGPGPTATAITPAISVMGAGCFIWCAAWLNQRLDQPLG